MTRKFSSSYLLTIAEMASKYNLTQRTLRFYEQRGLLQPLRLNSSRHYSQNDEIMLQIILKGKRLGLSLTEIERFLPPAASDVRDDDVISQMDAAEVEKRLASLIGKRDVINAAIEDLLAQLKKLD